MATYISGTWGKQDRSVASEADFTKLKSDLQKYSEKTGRTIYAVSINNSHVGMVSMNYHDRFFESVYGGTYKVWILE
jgi:hypothetical protein